MKKQTAAAIAALSLLSGLSFAAQQAGQPPEEEKLQELETVLIVGEQPGPGLWKVSKGDHVMWVLGSHAPLPKGMIWRSQNVEARIAESQEVLYSGGIKLDGGIGFLKGITLIPAALKAGKIPDKKTLKDVLDPATYDKWLVLRRKYIGKDDAVEKWRPSFALGTLRSAAFRKSGLGGVSVQEVVAKAQKKHKVRKVSTPVVERTIKVEDPRGMLKSAQKLALPDVECFKTGIDRMESDIEQARATANAWSRGDVGTLQRMYRNMPLKEAVKEVCGYALIAALNEGASQDAANAKKMMDDLLWHAEQAMVQSQLDWIAAARAALERNRSTFAVLNLPEVLSPDGHLAKLKALGYTVEGPSSQVN
jgi:hypothetical protein